MKADANTADEEFKLTLPSDEEENGMDTYVDRGKFASINENTIEN